MTDATAKRNKSTARRERRDRRHYLAGYLAGVEAGLKEAAGIADAKVRDALAQRDLCSTGNMPMAGVVHGAVAGGLSLLSAAIRARIAEIEGEIP
ncbi:hypothetical protein [Xanthobacter versatilis]|uniref:hypothetical protein n=1 Tax=Xanthobacter autotrophicus (strain ATCC BAA-1158 / Py2) TaxID=78245 RepID=UPI00372C5977